jgi:WD40 repeat protein
MNDKANDSSDDENKYTQLQDFVGLSSPPSNRHSNNDEQVSQRESVMSSLSSLSEQQEQGRNEHVEAQRRGSLESASSYTEEVINNIEIGSFLPNDKNDLKNDEFYDEAAIFNILFESNNSSVGIDNLFYKEKVKVNVSRKSDKNSMFQDKLRLVQTLKYHDGPIYTMKFSHSGEYLCTAGADTKLIVWCIGKIQLLSNNV